MARRTSIETYNIIKKDGLLSRRKMEVYEALFNHGPLTAHEIVKIYRGLYPNANQTGFNARLSELKSLGCAIEVGEKVNPTSGKSNFLWDVTENLPVRFEEPHRETCRTCKGKGYIQTQQAKFNI